MPNVYQKFEWWVSFSYEKEYLLIFLYITCSSLKLQNLGGFFEGLCLLFIHLCLLYTLWSGKIKTWFIDLHISIGVYLNDFDKSNITSLIERLLNVEQSAFSQMFCPNWKFMSDYWFHKFQLLKLNKFCFFCVENALKKCY